MLQLDGRHGWVGLRGMFHFPVLLRSGSGTAESPTLEKTQQQEMWNFMFTVVHHPFHLHLFRFTHLFCCLLWYVILMEIITITVNDLRI